MVPIQPMSHRVLIVEDHQLMRDGLTHLLRGEHDLQVIGAATTSETAWMMAGDLQPDVVVMDIDIPGEGGIAVTEKIRTAYPEMKVLIFSGLADPRNVKAALRAGAHGYIVKTHAPRMLLEAVRSVLAGASFLSPDISALIVEEFRHPAGEATGRSSLTLREVEVLKRIADGMSAKEIAFAMGLSIKTIETQRASLMAKLRLHTIAELTKYAIREGITTL